ncbi:MAG: hypothetical protein IPO21_04820 [Bacteroidales bacterium]|nr:hypothetical protein [Bacteroidales bacterium]
MKFTISISQKFGISFGILTLFAILALQITNQQINDIDEKTNSIIHEQKNTEKLLVQLSNIVNESTHLTKNWAYIDFEDNSPKKKQTKNTFIPHNIH